MGPMARPASATLATQMWETRKFHFLILFRMIVRIVSRRSENDHKMIVRIDTRGSFQMSHGLAVPACVPDAIAASEEGVVAAEMAETAARAAGCPEHAERGGTGGTENPCECRAADGYMQMGTGLAMVCYPGTAVINWTLAFPCFRCFRWPLASSLPGLSPLVASAAPLGFFQVVWFDMAALNHCALRPPAAGLKDNVLSHALAIEEVLERNDTGLVVLCAVQVLLVACLAPTYQLLQKP